VYAIIADARSQPSTIEQIDKLIQKGYDLKTKKIDSTYYFATTAFQKSKKIQYALGIAKAYTLVAYYYFDKSKYDTANILLNEALQFFYLHPEHQNSLEHGQILLHLGYVAVREQHLTLARTYAQNALNMFKLHDKKESILSAIVLLGGVESNEGNYAKGLAYYSNAFKIKSELNYPEEKFIPDYNNLAGIYKKIGQHEKAIQYFKKALALSEKYKYIERELINLNNLALAFTEIQKYDSAFYFYEQCISLADSVEKKELKNIALYNKANLLDKLGQSEKSTQLVKTLISSKPSTDVLFNASILLAKNYFKSGSFDSSIILASKLYKNHYLYSGNKEAIIELTNLLMKLHEVNKKYDSAFYFLNIKNSVADTLYNQSNQRKLNLLYAEMISLEKEKEIESLEKEKILQKKRNSSQIIVLFSVSLTIIFISVSIVLTLRHKDKIQKLKNIELVQQLEKKKRDLHQQTLKIIYMNNSLLEIENSLKKIKTQSSDNQSRDLEIIIENIHNKKTLDTEWENFINYFDQVYDQYTQKLITRFPNLSVSEKKLVLLIKMELKNREIASILNIDTTSVKMAKYRLKKKLQLPEEVDIQQYLMNFN
jgi:tetratricopeptide (TPR) repeat protein/DNA-binding CsgD family transcriptional regulator